LKAASTTIAPTITSQSEAQEEADCLNVINQLVIGSKEGIVKAVTKLVGSTITDAVYEQPMAATTRASTTTCSL
jgi:hypothetical protein